MSRRRFSSTDPILTDDWRAFCRWNGSEEDGQTPHSLGKRRLNVQVKGQPMLHKPLVAIGAALLLLVAILVGSDVLKLAEWWVHQACGDAPSAKSVEAIDGNYRSFITCESRANDQRFFLSVMIAGSLTWLILRIRRHKQ